MHRGEGHASRRRPCIAAKAMPHGEAHASRQRPARRGEGRHGAAKAHTWRRIAPLPWRCSVRDAAKVPPRALTLPVEGSLLLPSRQSRQRRPPAGRESGTLPHSEHSEHSERTETARSRRDERPATGARLGSDRTTAEAPVRPPGSPGSGAGDACASRGSARIGSRRCLCVARLRPDRVTRRRPYGAGSARLGSRRRLYGARLRPHRARETPVRAFAPPDSPAPPGSPRPPRLTYPYPLFSIIPGWGIGPRPGHRVAAAAPITGP